MAEKETVILPPKYYLDYFNYLVDFIEERSGHLLGDYGHQFISDFRSLSEDAQCLMIRMANRKGEYFRLSKLTYEEIGSTGAATEELIEEQFASLDPTGDPLIFKLFTKGELLKTNPEIPKNIKKDELLLELAENSILETYQSLHKIDTIIHFQRQEEINFLKLLFFGHNHGMMTEFVIRDVGNVKLENLDNYDFTPWFDSHEEAMAVFDIHKLSRTIRELRHLEMHEELLEFLAPINWSSLINYKNARKAGDKLMLKLGEYFEKTGLWEEALSYYALARKHPCRERQVRIYHKIGQKEEAIDLAQFIAESPYNVSEKIFAKDFLAKSGARNLRSTTTRIKLGHEITITNSGERVEMQALNHFFEQGWKGIHAENYLWRAMFGLLFWDELFDSEQAVFHHPLQRAPSDLYSSDFFLSRKDLLQSKLQSIRSKKAFLSHLQNKHDQKQGINNNLVGWHESLLPTLEACVLRLPLQGLKNVMLEIAKNVKDNSAGFPDLFLWKDKAYQFYEIKSPNDHLSAQQLFWLDFFEENKIKSEILRVRYE